MAAYGFQTTVTSTPTRLDFNSDPMTSFGLVLCNRGTVAVYLGGATVTTAGYQLDPGQSVPISGIDSRRDGIYGITASGSARVDTLKVGS